MSIAHQLIFLPATHPTVPVQGLFSYRGNLHTCTGIWLLYILWFKKNAPTLADYNYDPVQSILIIFSKLFVNYHKSCLVVKFSTSPHIWNTMLYFALITLLIAKKCTNFGCNMVDGPNFENRKHTITRIRIVRSSPNFTQRRNRHKFEFFTKIAEI